MSRIRAEELSFPTMPFLARRRDKMINDMGNRCDQGATRLYCAGRCGKSSLTSGSNLITCSLLSRALFCGRPAHWITVVQPLICRSGEVFSSFWHHFQACDCYDDVGPQKGETLAIVSTKMPAI